MANASMFDGFNKKILEAEKFLLNALNDAEKFGNESKENIESEISNVKSNLTTLKNNLTTMASEAADEAMKDIANTQADIEKAIEETKKEIEKYKTEKNKDMQKKYIEYLLNYANACSDLSVAVANEAKVAYLDAVAAQIDYVKEYGSF